MMRKDEFCDECDRIGIEYDFSNERRPSFRMQGRVTDHNAAGGDWSPLLKWLIGMREGFQTRDRRKHQIENHYDSLRAELGELPSGVKLMPNMTTGKMRLSIITRDESAMYELVAVVREASR